MADIQEIEKDLRAYLQKEPNLRKEDRIILLLSIFDKHMILSKLDHMVNYGDLQEIIGNAKVNYTKQRLPMIISGKDIAPGELTHIALIESLAYYLNKNNLLKRLIKIDYT